jgi:hypothetical protein
MALGFKAMGLLARGPRRFLGLARLCLVPLDASSQRVIQLAGPLA